MTDIPFKCHFTNEHSESCKFFHWAPGSTKSPSVSQPTLSTPTLPPIGPSATALSPIPTIIASGSTPTSVQFKVVARLALPTNAYVEYVANTVLNRVLHGKDAQDCSRPASHATAHSF